MRRSRSSSARAMRAAHRVVHHEEAGAFIQVAGHRFHRVHAVGRAAADQNRPGRRRCRRTCATNGSSARPGACRGAPRPSSSCRPACGRRDRPLRAAHAAQQRAARARSRHARCHVTRGLAGIDLAQRRIALHAGRLAVIDFGGRRCGRRRCHRRLSGAAATGTLRMPARGSVPGLQPAPAPAPAAISAPGITESRAKCRRQRRRWHGRGHGASGASRPLASACARAASRDTSVRPPCPDSSSATSCGSTATAARSVSSTAGERCSVPSRMRLSRFSIAQANSLMRARIDHAAAAFERMKRAPHGQQRFALERIVVPDRELLLDLGQLPRSLPRRTAGSAPDPAASSAWAEAVPAAAASTGGSPPTARAGAYRWYRTGGGRRLDQHRLGIGGRWLDRRHGGQHALGRAAPAHPDRCARCRACTRDRCGRPAASRCSTRG